MGNLVYKPEIIDIIKDFLLGREETISAGESVTSGHLQAALSLGTEASNYFQGGITAYNLGQKTRHLNVEPTIAGRSNCVAQKIADTMAIEVSKLFLSDYGLAITGYATIIPENEAEGLFAYFSMSYKGEIVLNKRLVSDKTEGAFEAQVDYTNQVLEHIKTYIEESQKN